MGIGEELKGAVKKKVGDATDNGPLEAEGNAQQTKGAHERAESEERAQAQAHEKKADALEREQDALEN